MSYVLTLGLVLAACGLVALYRRQRRLEDDLDEWTEETSATILERLKGLSTTDELQQTQLDMLAESISALRTNLDRTRRTPSPLDFTRHPSGAIIIPLEPDLEDG